MNKALRATVTRGDNGPLALMKARLMDHPHPFRVHGNGAVRQEVMTKEELQ